jgi:predicted MFS family arabinose efflux permease
MLNQIKNLFINSFSGLSRDIWLLSLVTLINRSGTLVIIFMTIYLTNELEFTKTQAGLAMSCFGAGSVAGSYVGGWLTDRIGYYATMFWSLLVSGFLFFILMEMKSFPSFCIMVFVVSMVGDSFRPANLASINAYSKPENKNRSLSLIRMAINLGFACGAGAAGILIATVGYRWLFIIDGTTCILAAFYFRMVLKEKPDPEEMVEKESEAYKNGSAYKDRMYLAFVFLILINSIVFFQLFSTLPVFYKEQYSLSEDQIGLFMLLNGLIIVVFEMPLIYILEKRYNRMTLIIAGFAMIGFSFLVYNLIDNWLLVILISISAVSLGEVISFPFSNAFALSRSTPGRRGQFMGLYTMAFSTAFIIAPTLGMWTAEHFGYAALWYLMSVLSVIACIGFSFLKYIEKKPKAKSEHHLSEIPLD